ncbi:hypothetical protein ZWY2020_034016 [Hordeum vulgare]|nr:hypothetical protein ZWY2020_034016 [Hordeum vulgare]
MINRMRMKIGGLIPRYIGVDVEYTREDKPPERDEVPQLCVEELCLESGLEINPKKYIDMQHKWRVPFMGGKRSHSLANVAGSVIHPFYKHMKYKINREEDHKLWGISPLLYYLIEYAVIDVYAMYESFKRIANIAEGLECSKEKETEAKEDYDYGYYGGGF